MLRTLATRACRGLRAASSGPAVTREPGVVGLPVADSTSRQVSSPPASHAPFCHTLLSYLSLPCLPPSLPTTSNKPVLLPSRTLPRVLPSQQLSDLYAQTLAAVGGLPESAAYRVNVEKVTRHRLGVVEGAADIEEIEATLGVGQIEEVIEQAQDELELIPHMAAWAPWETADGAEAVKIELID